MTVAKMAVDKNDYIKNIDRKNDCWHIDCCQNDCKKNV